jgi:serine/threonine protein kinase
MPLAPGDRLGPYEVRGLIGEGGMGVVYRAADARLGRDVALKCVRPAPPSAEARESDAQARARILHEARAASRLNHPNICSVYDVGETDGQAWIAMELVDGQSLSDVMRGGGLAPEVVLRYGIQIADALDHAHTRGVQHRDLKPANIALGLDGRVKVLDFGIAARMPESPAADVTRTADTAVAQAGAPAGTLAYVAPETLRGDPPGAPADLWALGVVLFELASGARPFAARTPNDLISMILTAAPAALPASTPAPLAAVIERLLQKDPTRRYHAAGEVRAVLEAVAGQLHPAPAVPGPEPARARMRTSSNWLTPARAAFGALALSGAVGLGLWWRSDDRFILQDHQLLSTLSGAERSPSLSPDGSLLAFVAPDGQGVSQIWVRNLAEGAPLQITSGAVAASRPRWSPSSDQIVFALAGQGIWLVPPLGGAPRRLLESGANPSLSADGARLAFERGREIWTAGADGSNAHRLDDVPPQYYAIERRPALSPDGRRVAFFTAQAGPNGDLWVAPVDGGDAIRLTFDTREGGSPAWTPDGRSIVFSSARAGSRTLWLIPATGGEPQPLTTGSGEDDEPEVSRDGGRLVYANVKKSWTLVVRDTPGAPDRQILEKHTEISFPIFSPDGRRLVFFGRQDRAVAISTIAIDGSDVRQLTGGTDLNHQPTWSADGAIVHFYQVLPALSWRRVPADGGPDEEVRRWDWEVQNGAMFSPSGRQIVYARRDERPATVIHDVQTGEERELSAALLRPTWSPDSRWIAGWRLGSVIARCSVDGGPCEDITNGVHARYSPDGSLLYFVRPVPSSVMYELMSVALDTKREETYGQIGPFRYIDRHFDVSSRGALAWSVMREERPEIWAARLGR